MSETRRETKQYNSIKFPKRPRKHLGLDIVGVDFGIPFYSFFYSSYDTLAEYTSLWKDRKKMWDDWKDYVSRQIGEDDCNSAGWKYRTHAQLHDEYREIARKDIKWSRRLTQLRKQIRMDKWEACKDEMLVVVHSKGWSFNYVGQRPFWRHQPKLGSVLVPTGSNENDTLRYYMYTPEGLDTSYEIKMKRGRAVIDAVVPLNEKFVGE